MSKDRFKQIKEQALIHRRRGEPEGRVVGLHRGYGHLDLHRARLGILRQASSKPVPRLRETLEQFLARGGVIRRVR